MKKTGHIKRRKSSVKNSTLQKENYLKSLDNFDEEELEGIPQETNYKSISFVTITNYRHVEVVRFEDSFAYRAKFTKSSKNFHYLKYFTNARVAAKALDLELIKRKLEPINLRFKKLQNAA